jgi:hypothetical protein
VSWTEEDLKYLRENAGKLPHAEIAAKLNKTRKAVTNKCWKLGLIFKDTFWSEEEIRILKDAYIKAGESGVVSLTKIAALVGRNKSNVCRKAKELGLARNPNRHKREPQPRKPYASEAKYSTPEERYKAWKKVWELRLKEKGHPRGMLGKHHSKEYCEKFKNRVIEEWKNMTPEKLEKRRIKGTQTKIKNGTLNPNINSSNPYSRTKSGKREDLNNTFFRSAWEANIARYFNYVGIKWQFEPKMFVFQDIKRGCVSYTPDFYLPDEDRWVEVKGWMDDKSKTKLNRFKKFYPEEYAKLEIISAKEYKEYAKYSRLIPNWEGR